MNTKMKILVVAVTVVLLGMIVTTVVDVAVCKRYRPPLRYPVVYVGNGVEKRARWSESAPTLILRDSAGVDRELPTRGGYYDEWCDSVYFNCIIGDTIK